MNRTVEYLIKKQLGCWWVFTFAQKSSKPTSRQQHHLQHIVNLTTSASLCKCSHIFRTFQVIIFKHFHKICFSRKHSCICVNMLLQIVIIVMTNTVVTVVAVHQWTNHMVCPFRYDSMNKSAPQK
jgi:hypothetical protein